MSSISQEISDAVVALLNDHTFNPPFTAARMLAPAVELSEISDLKVFVIPFGRKCKRETRGEIWTEDHTIQIARIKRFGKATFETAAQPYIDLGELISDYLAPLPIAGVGNARLIDIDEKLPYDAPLAIKNDQLFALLNLTYRLARKLG